MKRKKKRLRKKVKPLSSTKKQLKKALKSSNNKIKKNLNKTDYNKLLRILSDFKKGKDTKSIYSKKGNYTINRKRLHNKIIKFFLKQDKNTKSPDLYVLGGVAGSGKTTNLRRMIKERAINLNNDDIKAILAKVTPSPSKRFFLLHAALLHRESSDVEALIIKKLLRSKKDIIFDKTLANFQKQLKIIKKFHNKGYQITTFGTNLKPHIAIARVTKRFLNPKGDGRYVPLNIIVAKGNAINRNVLKMAKKQFNKRALVVDTSKRKFRIIYKK